jgi:hypothetical protein
MDELAGQRGDSDVVAALAVDAVVGGGQGGGASGQDLGGLDGEGATGAVAGLGDAAVVAVVGRLVDPGRDRSGGQLLWVGKPDIVDGRERPMATVTSMPRMVVRSLPTG